MCVYMNKHCENYVNVKFPAVKTWCLVDMMFDGVVYLAGTCSVHAHSHMTTQLCSGKVISIKYIN